MPVEFNNTTNSKVDLGLVEKIVDLFLKKYKLGKKEVSVAFVSDDEIRRINKKYRNKNKITDVLSFEGEGDFLGEILINYNQIKKQAKLNKNTVKYELIFILVHGLLHLIGYCDDTDKEEEEMQNIGRGFVEEIKNTL